MLDIKSQILAESKKWEDALIKYMDQDICKAYFGWGKEQEVLENKEFYFDFFLDLIGSTNAFSKVIEIGSYDGFWTQFLLKCKSIVSVDLFIKSGEAIIRRIGDKQNFTFYKTEGYELQGLESNSYDLIFSIDSLMRCAIAGYEAYFKEFYRVLKPGGRCLLHLPLDTEPGSIKKGFSNLTQQNIIDFSKEFEKVLIHGLRISHGIIVEFFKKG